MNHLQYKKASRAQPPKNIAPQRAVLKTVESPEEYILDKRGSDETINKVTNPINIKIIAIICSIIISIPFCLFYINLH